MMPKEFHTVAPSRLYEVWTISERRRYRDKRANRVTQWFSELSDYKMTQQARVCKPARRCAHGADGRWVIKLYSIACPRVAIGEF
jgi:hypothetical protein